MLSVTVTVKGTPEELAKFRSLGEKLTNFSNAMKQIGDELKSYYSGQVFASEGGAIGQRWANLSPVYAAWKSKHYPGRGILIATGKMQQSFVAHSDNNSVEVTNTATYFKYHQSSAPRKKMPYRPMLAINNDVKNIVQQIIDKDVKEKLSSM